MGNIVTSSTDIEKDKGTKFVALRNLKGFLFNFYRFDYVLMFVI
jgi:hypothetical protein